MNILILNPILYTSENKKIKKNDSIKDCMIYNMALGFKELGHNVTLIAAKEYEPNSIENEEFKIIYFQCNLKKIFYPNLIPLQLKLWRYLQKNKNNFDCIISSETFSFNSLFSSILASKKTIIWQELAFHQHKFFKIPSRIWHHLVVPIFLRKVLIVPRSEAAFLFIKKYSNRVTKNHIEHGINLNTFNFKTEKKEQFVVVSQLIERKNIESIISVFYKFKNKYSSNHHLLIIGKGDREEKLKQLVLELNLEQDVLFLGFKKHEELNTLISESEALLVNTKQDLNVVSINESIVSGTPILTNTIPLSATTVLNKELGIVKDNWNEDDLYQISTNNSIYVKNCIAFRKKLSNITSASEFINIYTQQINKHASSK